MPQRYCVLVLFAIQIAFAGDNPEALIHSGHFKRARAVLETRLRNNPNDAEALCLMSRIKQVWRDRDTALKYAEKAVELDGSVGRNHLQLAEVLGEMAQNASMLRQISLGRRFKKEIDLAVSLEPKNTNILRDLMLYYQEAPSIIGGDKAKAHTIADQIMQIDPVEGCFVQVQFAHREKEEGRIEGLYRKAVEQRPSSYDARVALGNYCASSAAKKYSEAESLAREAIKIDSDRIGAHMLLASVLVTQEKWTELDGALSQAEKDVPDNLGAHFRAANTCIATGKDLPRAERYMRKYLSQEPEGGMYSHSQAHWRLGLALEKQGRKADAIAELQKAVERDQSSPAKNDLKRLK